MSTFKANALKVISLINQKKGWDYVTKEDFDNGMFPWEMNVATTSSDQHSIPLYI